MSCVAFTCDSRRTTCRRWFSPSCGSWVSNRLSGLEANAFSTKNNSLALAFSLSHNSPWRPGHIILNGDKSLGMWAVNPRDDQLLNLERS